MVGLLKVINNLFDTPNILGLSNPEFHNGLIWWYRAGHSTLVLRVYDPKADFESSSLFVGFEQVTLLNIPTRWEGTNIRTASEKNTLEYCLSYDILTEAIKFDPKGFRTLGFRLYEFESFGKHFNILANSRISVSNEQESF